ncbi:MAG TPA: phage tail tip lysozyme [Kofleriaceae bacterium]|nr:phage tail tip lysozyme [Kofleriaceae bacterium]
MRPIQFVLASALLSACVGQVPIDDDPGADDQPPQPPPVSEAAQQNNTKTAFNFFVSKGLTKDQSAGIVGNLMQESSVSPTAVEYGGGPGRGIAQWSVGGRWDTSHDDNVTWYASQHGLNRWALTTQLDFIWFELTSDGYGYSSLKAATTVSAATIAFEDKYEICGECDQSKRISYAEQVLADYGGGGGGGGGGAAGCYSDTLGRQMQANACVQSKYDDLWYQCDNGSWVDRWSDPTACNGVYPL